MKNIHIFKCIDMLQIEEYISLKLNNLLDNIFVFSKSLLNELIS